MTGAHATFIRPIPAERLATAPAQVIAMWRAQRGALMLLGRVPDPLPKAGSARVATSAGTPGVFRAEFWPLPGETEHGFLMAVRLPQATDQADNADLILRGVRNVDRDLRLGLVAASGECEFGKEVAALAGAHGAQVARFMLDVLRLDDGRNMRQPSAVLEAFLTHAARPDGCVELIMHVPQKCVLLQGWGMQLGEKVEILLPGLRRCRHAAESGDFPRHDIAAPASGNVLVLQPDLVEALGSLEKVFVLAGDELLSRHVVEPRMLDAEASIGQIRHLLPRLTCPAPMLELLRATLQPRYDGRDTLNNAGRPVRAALDSAVSSRGGGAYLSGWLFDPGSHMAELHLCTEDDAVRLDESWVRVPREDVSAAFRADPAFPVPLSDESGFAVAVPVGPASDQPAYLRFTFTDGDLAFVPIRFVDAGSPAVLTALVTSVDLHKSSGISIVERHMAPFIAQMSPPPAPVGQILLHGPFERPCSIVVPLRVPSLPRSVIASFLIDPATSDEQIVFVCGPEWGHTQREALTSLIRFYGLPASVVGVAQSARAVEALRAAGALSRADRFLLMSPGTVGRAPGWRGSLRRAAQTAHVACPTVLFEDRSLRFAGPTSVTFHDRPPFASVHAPLAGAYVNLADTSEPAEMKGGTFACCLLQRSAFPPLAHAARFMTESGQEAAFFLALRDAGLSGAWVPSVKVSAPEDDAALAAPALPLIDGWMLRKTWGEPTPCVS